MATLFSDAFSSTTGLVPYRSNGALVKVATFRYVVPSGGVPVTTASRINLFLLPFNSRILRGEIEVVTNCGSLVCRLVASDAPTDTILFGSPYIILAVPGQNRVDRTSRGMLYTSPSDVPASLRANGGVRIALAPINNGTLTANGQLRGYFLYV